MSKIEANVENKSSTPTGLRHYYRVDTFGTLATAATPLGLAILC
jgi:hypothetical protein